MSVTLRWKVYKDGSKQAYLDIYQKGNRKRENLYSQLYQKHFKKTYSGKPTKRYLWIMEQIQRAERISPYEIERIIIS